MSKAKYCLHRKILFTQEIIVYVGPDRGADPCIYIWVALGPFMIINLTYQGLTTCTELDKSWTIMSSIYNHLRQGRDKSINELKFFIRAEVELQECLETMGYRSPTWRLLRALQSLLSAVQLLGESAVTAPPFFPSAGRGATQFWGTSSLPVGESGRRRTEGV